MSTWRRSRRRSPGCRSVFLPDAGARWSTCARRRGMWRRIGPPGATRRHCPRRYAGKSSWKHVIKGDMGHVEDTGDDGHGFRQGAIEALVKEDGAAQRVQLFRLPPAALRLGGALLSPGAELAGGDRGDEKGEQ